MHPEYRRLAEQILAIPQKRMQKKPIGYLYPEEILEAFKVVDLKKSEGFRDYCLLHLLFDSGARASEITTLEVDYLDARNRTLAIPGKGDRFRQIMLWPKTCDWMSSSIGITKKISWLGLTVSEHALANAARWEGVSAHANCYVVPFYTNLSVGR